MHPLGNLDRVLTPEFQETLTTGSNSSSSSSVLPSLVTANVAISTMLFHTFRPAACSFQRVFCIMHQVTERSTSVRIPCVPERYSSAAYFSRILVHSPAYSALKQVESPKIAERVDVEWG